MTTRRDSCDPGRRWRELFADFAIGDALPTLAREHP
jgi:hypothetical protein